jgi:alkaline phosphatase D
MDNPAATMTGTAQEKWLLDALKSSAAPFNLLAAQTWLAPFRYNAAPAAPRVNMDSWDGYTVQRKRLIEAMAGVSNPIVLSGDWHSAAAMRIHADPFDVKSRRVGHNFAGTSISSSCPWAPALAASKGDNPHVDYVDGTKRGYLRTIIDRRNCTAQFRTVTMPTDAQSPCTTELEVRTRDT